MRKTLALLLLAAFAAPVLAQKNPGPPPAPVPAPPAPCISVTKICPSH